MDDTASSVEAVAGKFESAIIREVNSRVAGHANSFAFKEAFDEATKSMAKRGLYRVHIWSGFAAEADLTISIPSLLYSDDGAEAKTLLSDLIVQQCLRESDPQLEFKQLCEDIALSIEAAKVKLAEKGNAA